MPHPLKDSASESNIRSSFDSQIEDDLNREKLRDISNRTKIDPMEEIFYNTEDTLKLVKRGKILCEQGRYNKGMDKFVETINISPKCSQSYFEWRNTLFEERDYDKTLKKYEKAVNIDFTYADAHFNFVQVLYIEENILLEEMRS